MTINELFEKIQDEFLPEELNGEFQLQGNCIIWTYNLDIDSEEIQNADEDDDDYSSNFESLSTEELLQDAYDEDYDAFETLLDELDEIGNWELSEPETNENIISFKIY